MAAASLLPLAITSGLLIQPAYAATTLTVLSYNIQGGGSPNFGSDAALTPVLNRLQSGYRPDVIALQEVCQTQATYFYNNGHSQYGYEMWWHPVRYDQGYCPGGITGDLIAVRSIYSPSQYSTVTFDSQSPTNQTQGLTCATFTRNGGAVRACSTHLPTADSSILESQTKQIKAMANNWIGNNVMPVVAGDFNSKPDYQIMNYMYNSALPNGLGVFNEADQLNDGPAARTGEGTAVSGQGVLRKVDYIFCSRTATNLTSGLSATVTNVGGYSNHKMLEGACQLL